jgi:hypothetical protein
VVAPWGCGDGAVAIETPSTKISAPEGSDTNQPTDTADAPDGGRQGPAALTFDNAACDVSLTCGQLADPRDCVANFELGTNQAGFNDAYDAVGFYAYNDHSEGAAMVPQPNPDNAEPAESVESCNPENSWVLHMSGSGFVEWGAGVGMDWGGPLNPSCEVEGALDCLQVGIDDDHFLLADAEANPVCDTEEKLDCLTKGKVIVEPRDLSAYKGIGFWVLRPNESAASLVKVGFPIPDTRRFYGLCSEDDDDPSTNCFNDFATTVRLLSDEVGRWVFKEILFEDLKIDKYWGLQLDITDFPASQSLGIKFQVDADQGDFDLYLDDIILLK